MKIAGSGSESGSISQRHGSADPDSHQMSWIRNTERNSYPMLYISVADADSVRYRTVQSVHSDLGRQKWCKFWYKHFSTFKLFQFLIIKTGVSIRIQIHLQSGSWFINLNQHWFTYFCSNVRMLQKRLYEIGTSIPWTKFLGWLQRNRMKFEGFLEI